MKISIDFDPRDELWNGAYDTYYDSYYEEIAAEKLINIWQIIDEITKFLVAATATGSAISGWALWSQPNWKFVWLIMAGVGATLAILHSTLSVPSRLKDWGENKRWFATLRIDIDTFRYRMRIDPNFLIAEFTKEFIDYRRRYGEGIQRLKPDILWTKILENCAQNELNKRLKNKSTSE